MGLMDRARELAAQTPPQRNRYVDFLRALSITVVVLGHWLMAVISVEDGRIVAGHLLAQAPWTQALTWVLQVMPVFFIVGGYSNAASWSAARKSGRSYADWLRGRCQRLLGPTAVFALAWLPLSLFARLWVQDERVLAGAARFVVVPLWFLAVYLMVVPLAPLMHALHRRLGAAVPMLLTLLAAANDFWDSAPRVKGELSGISIGWLNFAFVWLAVHQLGFFWQEGKLDRRGWLRWALVIAGLGGIIMLTLLGPYPVSMIGVPGQPTNNTPPSVVLILLALFQLGLILLSNDVANRWLSGLEPWARTILANGMIMTMYLWHLTALVLAVFVGFVAGLRFPGIEPVSGMWWLSRVAYLAVLMAVLSLFVAVFGRFERPRPPVQVGGGWRKGLLACVGALAAGAGLAGLALQGFYTPDEVWGVPLLTLSLLLLGSLAVGVTPRIYRRA